MAVGEVDGVAVGYEVFRYAVALYGEACVEYVVDGRRIAAAFAFGQVGTAAVGRSRGHVAGIGRVFQVVFDVGKGHRGGGAAGGGVHGGDDVGRFHFCAAGGCVVEFVAAFVYLAAVCFGVDNRHGYAVGYALAVYADGYGVFAVDGFGGDVGRACADKFDFACVFNLAAEGFGFVAGSFVGADDPAHVGQIACGGRAGFLCRCQVAQVKQSACFRGCSRVGGQCAGYVGNGVAAVVQAFVGQADRSFARSFRGDGHAVAANFGHVARSVFKLGAGQVFELFGQFDVQAVCTVRNYADVVVAQFGRVGYAAFDVHGAAQFAFNVRAAVACKGQRVVGHCVQLAAVHCIRAGCRQCTRGYVGNLFAAGIDAVVFVDYHAAYGNFVKCYLVFGGVGDFAVGFLFDFQVFTRSHVQNVAGVDDFVSCRSRILFPSGSSRALQGKAASVDGFNDLSRSNQFTCIGCCRIINRSCCRIG